MKTYYYGALTALLAACGSPADPGRTAQLTGADAGVTGGADAGTTSGVDAGVDTRIHCTGSLEVAGRLGATPFNVVSVPPTGTTSGECYLTMSNTALQFDVPNVGQVRLVMRNIESMPHDGTPFPLTDAPTVFGFVWTPDANSLCVNQYGQLPMSPSYAGTVTVAYSNRVPGQVFKADIAGPISCDGGNTYFDTTFHLETVWQ